MSFVPELIMSGFDFVAGLANMVQSLKIRSRVLRQLQNERNDRYDFAMGTGTGDIFEPDFVAASFLAAVSYVDHNLGQYVIHPGQERDFRYIYIPNTPSGPISPLVGAAVNYVTGRLVQHYASHLASGA